MPDNPPPDYEAIEIEMWRKNAKEVADEVKSGSERLKERIGLYVSRFGFSEQEVRDKIVADSMFAAYFAKEPRRMGFHEAAAAKWINCLSSVKNFKVLPKGGANAIYVTSDGNIQTGPLKNRPGKSLDFMWETGKTICYAMHKYTKEGGGNQDSQFQEMVLLLRNFQSCNDKNCILFVIADGEYYHGKKMNELRNHVRSQPPKSYALSIQELPGVLENYL